MDDEILAMCDQLELPTMVLPNLQSPPLDVLQLYTRIVDSFEHCSVAVSAL